jgi:Rrf2 family nitric oxide-sensitive transcriptional repressor
MYLRYTPLRSRIILPMQLTLFTDYALRLLIFLAHRDGLHTTIREVSEAHAISEDHLMKVVRRLAALGFVRATRGRRGGIAQARKAAEISVGDVVRAIEPFSPAACFAPDFDGRCRLHPACGLRATLEDARDQFFGALDAYSVADIMGRTLPARRPSLRRAPAKRHRTGKRAASRKGHPGKRRPPAADRSVAKRRPSAARPSARARPKGGQTLVRDVPADR